MNWSVGVWLHILDTPFGCYLVQVCTAGHMKGQLIKRWGEARNSDFIQKASRLKRWWTSVPKNHPNQVRIWVSFILKGERMWLVVANFLVLARPWRGCNSFCSWPCRSDHDVLVNLCVLQLFISILIKSVIPLKVKPGRRNLEIGLYISSYKQ